MRGTREIAQARRGPEQKVNQPVARSQTEDCYREIPRDSIWPEVWGGKHGARVSIRARPASDGERVRKRGGENPGLL